MDLMDKGTLASAVRRGLFVAGGTIKAVSRARTPAWKCARFLLSALQDRHVMLCCLCSFVATCDQSPW